MDGMNIINESNEIPVELKSGPNVQNKKPETKENNNKQKKPNSNRKTIGANWDQANIKKNPVNLTLISSKLKKQKLSANPLLTNCLAIDCEMVGVGVDGLENMLARVTIVNENCDVVMDKYVKPQKPVVNYRTRISGIRPKDLENGEEFKAIQKECSAILKNRIIIGHAVQHDFTVLGLLHPLLLTRDTSRYNYFRKNFSNGKTPSLKNLAKQILAIDIQASEHNSIEDASATMQIYNKYKVQWERSMKKSGKARKFD